MCVMCIVFYYVSLNVNLSNPRNLPPSDGRHAVLVEEVVVLVLELDCYAEKQHMYTYI